MRTNHFIIQNLTAEEGLDLILSHFELPVWPRTISTKATEGRQILVHGREEALVWFKACKYLDCRINAYPNYVEWQGINRQAPNLVFIDLDLARFKSHETLDMVIKKTLKNIKDKFQGGYPTVLYSGNGYHIPQPIEAFVLESEGVFASFENPSMKFLRFAEPYLSNNQMNVGNGN